MSAEWRMEHGSSAATRAADLEHALRLEYLTVGWNVIEGTIAVAAALSAGSIALLGFGIDSFVECLSGAVLIWRLQVERRARDPVAVEALDRQAHRLVGISLFALAGWIAFDATRSLWVGDRPEPSMIGIVLTSVSLGVMWWLARSKRRAAKKLASRSLEADSFQTTACWWLSIIVLGGIGLNAALGWWWADPIAALGMTFLLVREGRNAWRENECCG